MVEDVAFVAVFLVFETNRHGCSRVKVGGGVRRIQALGVEPELNVLVPERHCLAGSVVWRVFADTQKEEEGHGSGGTHRASGWVEGAGVVLAKPLDGVRRDGLLLDRGWVRGFTLFEESGNGWV